MHNNISILYDCVLPFIHIQLNLNFNPNFWLHWYFHCRPSRRRPPWRGPGLVKTRHNKATKTNKTNRHKVAKPIINTINTIHNNNNHHNSSSSSTTTNNNDNNTNNNNDNNDDTHTNDNSTNQTYNTKQ